MRCPPGRNPIFSAMADATQFIPTVVQTATAQWEFFGEQTYDIDGHLDQNGHKEGEDGFYQRIGRSWLEGTGTRNIDGRDHEYPWSAAFISWVMKTSGAGSHFRYSTQHSVYISQAIRDHMKGNDVGFWGWRLNEHRPAVGDLVCWAREAGVDFDHQKSGNYAGHCDIVVEVTEDEIFVIGGNVGNSVTRRPLALHGGFLTVRDLGGETLFSDHAKSRARAWSGRLKDRSSGGAITVRRRPLVSRAASSPPRLPRQRHHRDRHDAVDHPLDVVEVALAFRQFGQPLAFADGVVRHGQREVQAPIEIDVVAAGQRAAHRGDEFPQMVDLAVLDAADRRHRFDRGADHEARRGRALLPGPEAAAQGRADQRAQDLVDRRPPAAVLLRGPQFVAGARGWREARVTNSSAINSSLEPKW